MQHLEAARNQRQISACAVLREIKCKQPQLCSRWNTTGTQLRLFALDFAVEQYSPSHKSRGHTQGDHTHANSVARRKCLGKEVACACYCCVGQIA
eukprot:2096198-Rhodomonas_salina.1